MGKMIERVQAVSSRSGVEMFVAVFLEFGMNTFPTDARILPSFESQGAGCLFPTH